MLALKAKKTEFGKSLEVAPKADLYRQKIANLTNIVDVIATGNTSNAIKERLENLVRKSMF